jgi:hypothetical protein
MDTLLTKRILKILKWISKDKYGCEYGYYKYVKWILTKFNGYLHNFMDNINGYLFISDGYLNIEMDNRKKIWISISILSKFSFEPILVKWIQLFLNGYFICFMDTLYGYT